MTTKIEAGQKELGADGGFLSFLEAASELASMLPNIANATKIKAHKRQQQTSKTSLQTSITFQKGHVRLLIVGSLRFVGAIQIKNEQRLGR